MNKFYEEITKIETLESPVFLKINNSIEKDNDVVNLTEFVMQESSSNVKSINIDNIAHKPNSILPVFNIKKQYSINKFVFNCNALEKYKN